MGIVLAYLCILNAGSSLWDYKKRQRQHKSGRQLTTQYVRQKSQADEKYAIKSMGEGSVYSFFLTDSKLAWSFALATVALQLWLLHPFIVAAEFDLSDDVKDLVYTWKCDRVSDQCEDLGDVTWQGWFLFGLLMTAYMGKDMVCGGKMITLSGKSRHDVSQRIRFFVGGTLLSCVSVYIFYASTIYNISIATTNTELIYNAVIILFIMEMDERVFETIDAVNQRWIDKVTKRRELEGVTMSGRGDRNKKPNAKPSNDKLDDVNDEVFDEIYELKRKLSDMEKSMNSFKEHWSARTTVDANLLPSGSLSSSRASSRVPATLVSSSVTSVSSTFEQRLKEKLDESVRSAQGSPPNHPGEGILRGTSDMTDDQRSGGGNQVSFVGDLDAN